MENAPTDEAIQAFANKSKDRWAQALAIVNRPAGYADKDRPRTETNIYVQINHMSDAQLRHEFEGAMRPLSEAGVHLPGSMGNAVPVGVRQSDET